MRGVRFNQNRAPPEVVEAKQRSRSKLRQEQQETRQPITHSLTIMRARIPRALAKPKLGKESEEEGQV
jgi:hypothetical protein